MGRSITLPLHRCVTLSDEVDPGCVEVLQAALRTSIDSAGGYGQTAFNKQCNQPSDFFV